MIYCVCIICIYKLYALCFLDHIWYSLEHTGNARTYQGFARTYQANTSNIPGSHERLYRDWPKGYTRVLAQGIVIGYAKTPLDCPQLPSRKKTMNNFLGNGHALASLSQGIRNIQRISARKKMTCWKHRESRTTRGQLVERPCWDVERLYWDVERLYRDMDWGIKKKSKLFLFIWCLCVLTFGGLFVPNFNEQTRGWVCAHKRNNLQKSNLDCAGDGSQPIHMD